MVATSPEPDFWGLTTSFPLGDLVIEGKTKKIITTDDPNLVMIFSKDDITAGDGAKHDVISEKGRLANGTTCNTFRLLKSCGIDVAFEGPSGPHSFIAPKCKMLPYEVVVRREAHGSYLKCNPHLSKGQLFPKLIVQIFLKTKDRRWKEHELVCDDPLMEYMASGKILLFNPKNRLHGQEPFLVLSEDEVFGYPDEWKIFPDMERIASQAFLMLEKAWQLEGGKLVDFKVEFGFGPTGKLLLADVIDNDSWRVIEDGSYIDKQVYRDGGALDDVAAKYRRVAEITSRFRVPRQQIILWCGSGKDKIESFSDALGKLSDLMNVVVCSAHKEPVNAAQIFQRLIQEVPDSVVIAYIGRSNGAGPTLSAQSTVPVITVPASGKDFPDDVWSSLRSPSNVPVMTVLEPANAILAALQILSARNPLIYAQLRSEIEKRLVNVIEI